MGGKHNDFAGTRTALNDGSVSFATGKEATAIGKTYHTKDKTTAGGAESTIAAMPSRAKLVFNAIQAKFRFEQASLIQLVRNQHIDDFISFADFAKIKGSLLIELSPEEHELIKTHFSAENETLVHWSKLMKFIDVLPPPDFVELDHFLDSIPEPLATIVSVVELDIFDRAWLEIIRLHPEIPIDEEGNSLVVRRNRNLEIFCPPSVTQPMEDTSCSPVVAVTSCLDLMCFATADGSVKLVRGGHQVVVPVQNEADKTANCLFSTVRLSNAVAMTSLKTKTSIVRFVFYCIWELDSSKEVVMQEAATVGGKKPAAPPKGKDQPAAAPAAEYGTPKRLFGLKFKILEAVEDSKVRMRYSLRIADEWVSCDAVGGIDASLMVSLDGKILSLCHGDNYATIFEVPALNSSVVESVSSLAPVMEDGEHQESGSQVCSFACKKILTVNLADLLNSDANTTHSSVNKLKFWQFIPFLPFQEGSMDGKSKKTVDAPLMIDFFRKYQYLVVPDNSTRWLIAGFNPKPPLQAVASTAASAAPVTSAAGKGGPVTVAPSADAGDVTAEKPVILGSWTSSAIISSLTLDTSYSAVAFGTIDGTVTVWDLMNRALLCVCAKHLARITCLSFSEGSDNYLLCSGSSDGAVCFNQIKKFGKQFIGQNYEPTSKLIQSRVDAYTSSVECMLPVEGMSLIACVYSNGTTGMYDAESGSLLGQMVLCIGMEAQLSVSRPVSEYDQLLKWSNTESASKYVSSNLGAKKSKILCATGKFGLSVFYDKTQKTKDDVKDKSTDTICAVFSAEKIVESLCPGVLAIKKALKNMEQSPDLSSTHIFKLLSPIDRMNSSVSIAAIQDTLSYEHSNSRRRVSSMATIPETPPAVLTEERLKVHNNFNLALKPPPAPLGKVSTFATTGSMKRSALANSLLSSLKNSTAEAGKRKNNNVKLLNEMMAMMPSS